MAIVYWIHLPEHSDIMKEGYVGVTTRNPEWRLSEHNNIDNNPRHDNIHLSRAFDKYGNQIKIKTLLIGSEDYCYEMETKLRPQPNIGWNINCGGDRPPKMKGATLDLSEIERDRRSKWMASLNMVRTGELNPAKKPEVRKKISIAKTGSNNNMFGIFGDAHPRFGAIGAARGKLWYYDPINNEEKYFIENTQPAGWVKGRKKRR